MTRSIFSADSGTAFFKYHRVNTTSLLLTADLFICGSRFPFPYHVLLAVLHISFVMNSFGSFFVFLTVSRSILHPTISGGASCSKNLCMGIDPAAYRDLFLRQRFRFPCDAPILLCYLFSEQMLFAASPFHPLLYSSHSHRRFPSSAHTICCAMVFLFAGYHFHPPHFYFAMELSFCIGHALPAFQNIFSVFRFPRQSLCAFFLFAPKTALKKRRHSRVFREHSISYIVCAASSLCVAIFGLQAMLFLPLQFYMPL